MVQAKVEPLDHIIAIVDDDVVLSSELDTRLRSVVARLNAQGTPLPAADVLATRILDQLVVESIQLQKAERVGMRVDDNQLNETMASIAARNGYSTEQFEQALRSEGLSYREAREQIRREMLISRIQQRSVDRRVRVTDLEIATFLESAEGRQRTAEEYYIGHILIAIPANADQNGIAAVEAKARGVLEKLKAGADFKKTAVEISDGSNALQGGVIGWRKERELPSIAADILPKLAINEPSGLIRSGSGFHIVTPLDKRGGKTQWVQQHKVRHILVQPSEIRTELEAQAIVRQLHHRIVSGDDFAELAKAHSDDPGSAVSGGDLGWVSPGEMVPEFEDMMKQTPVGELSEPFNSQFGWHILQVLEKRQEDMGAQIQEKQARQLIHRRKYELELVTWLQEIREEAYVNYKGEFSVLNKDEPSEVKDEAAAKDEADNDEVPEPRKAPENRQKTRAAHGSKAESSAEDF